MKKPILYIAILYVDSKLGFTYYIDVNYFIEHCTILLNNAFQEGMSLLNNTLKNGSNINLPKFKEGFDITKPTFLDLSKTTLDNTIVWDRIIKNPRPFIYSGPNLHLKNIPFLGVSLGVVTIFINNGLGFSERVWSGLEGTINFLHSKLIKYSYTVYNSFKTILNNIKFLIKKFYGCFFNTKNDHNRLCNNQYINSVIENFQRNFLVFPSTLGSFIANTTTDYTISLEITLNQNIINLQQNFYQDLITGHVESLIGRAITFNWNRPNNLLNVTNLPYQLIERVERNDTLYNYFDFIFDVYSLEQSFQLTVDFGINSLSNNFFNVGNVYNLNIYDFGENWRGLNFFITFLEVEIESMQQAHASLIRGGTNVELFTFNGEMGMTWTIRDFNHLLDMYNDFNTQLNKKLVVLQFLKSIKSYMESRA